MDSVNNDEKLTPAVIIAVIVIMAMAVIEFISNYKYCDNEMM